MYSFDLNPDYPHRLLTDVRISGVNDKVRTVPCVIDTGCVNTLIDSAIIKYLNYVDLGFDIPVVISSKRLSGRAIVLSKVNFGGLNATKVLVFATPLIGTPVSQRMLLGLNTMNCWNYEVKRVRNVVDFTEAKMLPRGANSKNKYLNYFNKDGSYVLLDEAR